MTVRKVHASEISDSDPGFPPIADIAFWGMGFIAIVLMIAMIAVVVKSGASPLEKILLTALVLLAPVLGSIIAAAILISRRGSRTLT
ncbi:hypothetical protein GCM10027079_03520 [Sediminivirga luteola]|uniref:Uncharacterized protein n=1 Tax=Sediminivirga luteola TaxID=1774748 RepID=A0A8J2XET0_9MICO|nr:hypothetical protein GCM10011333_11140 [Sediminivirga luteola]